jgi:hypothetical protein
MATSAHQPPVTFRMSANEQGPRRSSASCEEGFWRVASVRFNPLAPTLDQNRLRQGPPEWEFSVMIVVTGRENLYTLDSYRSPLGVTCQKCQHRAVIAGAKLGAHAGNMKRLIDLKLLTVCDPGFRDVHLREARGGSGLHGARLCRIDLLGSRFRSSESSAKRPKGSRSVRTGSGSTWLAQGGIEHGPEMDAAGAPGNLRRPTMASSEPGRMLAFAPFHGFIRGMSVKHKQLAPPSEMLRGNE